MIRAAARRIVGRIPRPSLHSRRGLFIVFVFVAGIGSALTVGTVVAVQWTETADFCGRCHTMGPEIKAYQMSPHREVPCVDCHTEPGIDGWIKAKINGTRQLFQVLTGTFPKPVPPPNHSLLPPTSATCLKCHDTDPLVANGGAIKLVLQNRYRADEHTTRDTIALVVRPFGFGAPGTTTSSSVLRGTSADAAAARTAGPKGVHWHIVSDVEYVAEDEHAQKIDYVAVTGPDGKREDFIAASAITVSSDVQPDIDRLRASGTHRMDCIDCHNRIGHGIPRLDAAIDGRIDAGEISTSLPWIKREAVSLLSTEYASVDDADEAIDGLRDFYAGQYPLVAQRGSKEIDAAIASLKSVYALVATPDMQVTAATYPDNLGHQSSPGCFRCHDGAHYRVVDGAVSNETIPSQCATCHTFPQIGSIESGVLIGQRPGSHNDRLWVFNHKADVTSADPTGQSCATCHTRTYCENCHRSTAVNVTHESMVTNHGTVSREVGTATCGYCHSPSYCAQCHANDVLPTGPSNGGPPGTSGDGGRAPPSPSP